MFEYVSVTEVQYENNIEEFAHIYIFFFQIECKHSTNILLTTSVINVPIIIHRYWFCFIQLLTKIQVFFQIHLDVQIAENPYMENTQTLP